ncbi:MAG: hypothetical protein ACM31H_01030 [Nitrososphaerales archaeon]
MIEQVKSIGMHQALFLFDVIIPNIPIIGANNLQFQVVSASIPGNMRSADMIRHNNEEIVLPSGKTTNHEWPVTVRKSQQSPNELFDQIIKWGMLVDSLSVGQGVLTIKTDAYVKLLGLDKSTVTNRFIIKGIWPKNDPELTGLDHTATEGILTYEITFAYDIIDHDPDHLLTF